MVFLRAKMERAQVHPLNDDQHTERLDHWLEKLEVGGADYRRPEVLEELAAIIKVHHQTARFGDLVEVGETENRPYANSWTYIIGEGGAVLPLYENPRVRDSYCVPPAFPVLSQFGEAGLSRREALVNPASPDCPALSDAPHAHFGLKYWSVMGSVGDVVWFDAAPYADEILRNADAASVTVKAPMARSEDCLSLSAGQSGEAGLISASPDRLGVLSRFTRKGETFTIGSYEAELKEQTPEAIRALLGFIVKGLLPWSCCCSESEAWAERTLLIGDEIIKLFREVPGTGWRWLARVESRQGNIFRTWQHRLASGEIAEETETELIPTRWVAKRLPPK